MSDTNAGGTPQTGGGSSSSSSTTPTPGNQSNCSTPGPGPGVSPGATVAVTMPNSGSGGQMIATVTTIPQATATAPQMAIPQTFTQIVSSLPQTQVQHLQQVQASPSAHTPHQGAVVRSSLPQVQVIQGHQFVQPQQQQYIQQQMFLQGIAAMQSQQIQQQPVNIQGVVPSVGSKSPSILAASPQSSQQAMSLKGVAVTQAGRATGFSKINTGMQVQQQAVQQQHQQQQQQHQQQQQTFSGAQIYGAKQVFQQRAGQPLVIGQLVNQQGMVAQPRSPSVSQAQQVINSPTQIRFSNQPTFVTSQGQIFSGNPAVFNQLQLQQNLPLAQQQIIGTQAATIQPVYIRSAGGLQGSQGINVQTVLQQQQQQQQQQQGKAKTSADMAAAAAAAAAAGMQVKSQATQVKTMAVGPGVKGVANILPQTARPQGAALQQVQLQSTGAMAINPTVAKGVQTGQFKQVSKVRAIKAHPRPGVATVGAVTPVSPTQSSSRSGPQLVGQVRPGIAMPTTRPPTVMLQPVQRPAETKSTSTGTAPVPKPASSTSTVSQLSTAHTSPGNPQSRNNSSNSNTHPNTDAAATTTMTVQASPSLHPPEEVIDKDAPGGSGEDVPMATEQTPAAEEIKREEPMDVDSTGEKKSQPVANQMGTGRAKSDKVAMVTGERQQAIVRPHVLTHIIEGFVIQEAPEPFPVQRSSVTSDFIYSKSSGRSSDPSDKDGEDSCSGTFSDSQDGSLDPEQLSRTTSYRDAPKLKCEFCGKMDYAHKFRRSKRFCSRACAKRYNVGCSRRMGLFKSRQGGAKLFTSMGIRKRKTLPMKRTWKRGQGGRVTTGPIQRSPEGVVHPVGSPPGGLPPSSSPLSGVLQHVSLHTAVAQASNPGGQDTTTSSESEERSTSPSARGEESSSPRSPPELERVELQDLGEGGMMSPRRPLSQWSVQEVYDFVRNLPGCSTYADEFNRQEIDGQALMLLKEDHLVNAMNIKLGPALKICARINGMKDDLN